MSDAARPLHERFNNRVQDYARYRPSYPPELLDWLAVHCGLGPGCIVADLGAGTGIFSELLLERGAEVFAIEPNAEMRAVAEGRLGERRGYHSVAGNAETTGLPDQSVQLVTAAQAFHWFDLQRTRAEVARILQPDGWGMAVWNDRCTTGTPFLEGCERLLHQYGIDYVSVVARTERQMDQLDRFFDAGTMEQRTFDSSQSLDEAGLIGRMLSSSYVPAAGQPGHDLLLAELRNLFARTEQQGRVTVQYATRMFVGRVTV